MFDQIFVAPERGHAPSMRFLASALGECAVVALAILLSVLASPHLPVRQLRSLLIVPRPPLAVTPKSPVPESAVRRPAPLPRFLMPGRIAPVRPIQSTASPAAAPDLAAASAGTVPFGIGSPADGVVSSIGETSVTPRAPEPAPNAKANSPVRVGGAVAAANLTTQILPVYPPLAHAAHVQGTVLFRAIIGKDGRIANLELVSGHPLLVRAAREAVLQWRYRPTLLNGLPVEVATEITVHFSLGHS